MTEKILCVDDEANVLAAFRRNLRKAFEVETAQSPEGARAVLLSPVLPSTQFEEPRHSDHEVFAVP